MFFEHFAYILPLTLSCFACYQLISKHRNSPFHTIGSFLIVHLGISFFISSLVTLFLEFFFPIFNIKNTYVIFVALFFKGFFTQIPVLWSPVITYITYKYLTDSSYDYKESSLSLLKIVVTLSYFSTSM